VHAARLSSALASVAARPNVGMTTENRVAGWRRERRLGTDALQSGGMDAEIVREASVLEDIHEEWDRLAVAAARPYCAPAWMLAWWRHVAPPDAELCAVVVRAAGDVVGIAPFFGARRRNLSRWRLLGSGTSSRREPLCRRGLELEAAAAFARAIAESESGPDLLVLEDVPADSPWPGLLAAAWPGRPAWSRVDWTTQAPTLDLRGKTYDAWFASKSSSFRKQMRRVGRQLEDRGGSCRLSEPGEVPADLRAFAALHHARWQSRGGSQALDSRVEAMLLDVAKALSPSRFRLWSTDVSGRTISSQLFLAAGGEVAYWLGGFDDAWAPQQPAMQTILAAIEDALARGDARLDLGPGSAAYKDRFADGEDLLQTVTLVPRGAGYRRVRATLVPDHLRGAVTSRLPERWKQAVRRLVGGRR
jgi:CelD/BcsL family acetyltransferase involved in cellulose biosynthesis